MQPSDATATAPGYPAPEVIHDIFDAAAASMQDQTGCGFKLHFNTD